MKKLKNVKIRKILAFTVALALTMSCMPSAYTISADEIFGDGTEELFTDGEDTSVWTTEEITPDVSSTGQEQQVQQSMLTYENDMVRVTAEAQDEGAIPQNTSLKANPDEQEVEELVEKPEENEVENTGGQETENPAENTEQPDEETVENPKEDPEKNPDEDAEENLQEPEEAASETSYIEVIADEVNLRVSPSEDGEVIDTVNAGTRLPLLDIVEAEDGTTWYKVSRNEAEAYIRSDMAQLVEKETEKPAEEEVTDMEQEEPVTYTKTVDNVIVTATAANGVIPEDAEFIVAPVKKESDQYSEVEALLENKAGDEDYSIAGFLAYDIYFVSSDGEKLNPEDGKVKISMEYERSEAPEEVKEAEGVETFSLDGTNAESDELFQSGEDENVEQQEFDIAVMHLVEDENGNVQSVVDMTQDGTASVEANAEGEVQKAEFETESFSVFTITWKKDERNNGTITITLIDTAGNPIGSDSSIALESEKEYKVSEIAPTIQNYIFSKAKVATGSTQEGTEIQRLRKIQKNGNQYSTNKTDNSWKSIGKNNTVYFVYEYLNKELNTVNTVDHTQDGITMTMTDLVNGADYRIGKSADNLIYFGESGGYGSGNIKSGLLKNRLGADGYPVTVADNQSIQSLFSGDQVNHLFPEDTYKNTGYYEYSSFKNYAYLQGNKFTVYDAIGTPKNEDRYFYKRGNFMPYNAISEGRFSTNRNLYDEDGNELSDTDPAKGKELYLTQGTDYYFSMYMGANFLQPKDGKVTAPNSSQKESMIYEFNGDDDMWIYVDDVLMLDIGGVHDAHSGKINFETGVISWKDCTTGATPVEVQKTIKAMFEEAKKFPDGTDWDDSKVDDYFDGDTFKDYTMHSFKMFYMERGAGASNLHVKFNIQVIPSGQVEVRKALSNTDKEKYSNVKFAFQVYAQKIVDHDRQGNEIYSDTEYELLNSSAFYGNNGKPTSEAITFCNGEDGKGEKVNGKKYQNVFYLRPDESAIFKELKANRKYYVKEVGVKAEEYDQIKINNTSYTEFDENNQQTGEIKDIMTDTKQVSERPVVVYTNNCSGANSRELQITKKMNPDVETDDTFSFKIELGSDKDHLQEYSGEYYLTDKDGNYYTYDENNKLVNKEKNSTVCGTTHNGIISGIKKDYTVAITAIISETYYRVTEDLSTEDKEKYKDPVYESRNVVRKGETGHQNEEAVVGNEGTIKLYYDAAVTVTNTPYSKIKVNKIWKAGSSEIAGMVPVYAGLYQKTVNDGVETLIPVKDKYLKLDTENKYEAVFNKLDSRVEYVVKELRPITGKEEAEFTIKVNGTDTGYIKTDSTIMIGDSEYEVSYSDLTVDVADKRQKNITITNKRYCSITIIKTDSKDDKILLEGAEFKLQKEGQDVKDEKGKVITVTTDSEGRAKFSRLEPGTYTIVEIKAPQGYSITGDVIRVTLGNEEGQLLDVVQTITNSKIYSLPSAGGPGIYGFTISGVAILATALLLFINSKRKEEEAERS